MKLFLLALTIFIAGCSPKNWSCDDPMVTSSVRTILSKNVSEQTEIIAAEVAAQGKKISTTELVSTVSKALEDTSRVSITDVFDASFDKAIGKRSCTATLSYSLPEAAIPVAAQADNLKVVQAAIGAFSYDKKSGKITSKIMYSSQPSSDGAKILTQVESSQGALPSAFLFESLWAAAKADAQLKIEQSKKREGAAVAKASFRHDCAADVKVKSIQLGGLSEDDAKQHATEVCDEAAENFEKCIVDGGKQDACTKLSYTTAE